jgi:hypothetical protein
MLKYDGNRELRNFFSGGILWKCNETSDSVEEDFSRPTKLLSAFQEGFYSKELIMIEID